MTGRYRRSRSPLRLHVAANVAVVCSLAALGIVAAAAGTVESTAASSAESMPPDYALYVAGGPGDPAGSSLERLDPVTLLDSVDRASAPFTVPTAASPGAYREWSASADGATVLAVEYPPANGDWMNPSDVTYAIFDGGAAP